MSKLYSLGEQYRKFNEFIDNAWDNEDLTEDDLQLYIETLEAIEDEISVKVENIAKFLKNINSDIEALKGEEKRLAQKRRYLENKSKGLKDYTQNVLETNKLKSLKAGLFNVRLQKNNASVKIVDPNKVPNTYKIAQDPKIDGDAILKELKAGKSIEGVELVTDKQHLRIS